jgi:predicted metal-dependent hydrolase
VTVSTGRSMAVASEQPATARLPGGDLPYLLRRTPRARRLRVVVHPDRGLVVTVPPASSRGWAHPDAMIRAFLVEREPWIRRHLDRAAVTRARLAARPALGAGREILYLGSPHRVHVAPAAVGARVTRIVRVGADDGDELVVERLARDQRPTAAILEGWLRARAREAIALEVARRAPAMSVRPGRITIRDTTSRWGSCSRSGALSFSWRLILAPPPALQSVVAHELCHLRQFGHGPAFKTLLAAQAPDHARWRRWLRQHATELHATLDEVAPEPAASL